MRSDSRRQKPDPAYKRRRAVAQQAACHSAFAGEVSRLWEKFSAQDAEGAPVRADLPASPCAPAGQSTPACPGDNRPRPTSAIAFAKLLGDALGIKLDRVVRIEIAVDSGNLPTLKVTHLITERQAGLLQVLLQDSQFELVPLGEVKLTDVPAEELLAHRSQSESCRRP